MLDFKLQLHLTTRLSNGRQHYDLEPLLQLLASIQEHGNLQTAATACGYSYRKAWDILKRMTECFGTELVCKRRGRGSRLSSLGVQLLQIKNQAEKTCADDLTEAEKTANSSLESLLSASQTIRINASDSVKLNQLRNANSSLQLRIEGSEAALKAYAAGECDAAGFHIQAAPYHEPQLQNYCQYLNSQQDHFILLEQRQQGLISHPDRPIISLEQIVKQRLKFVNRQQGSGTRNLLDRLVRAEGIKIEQLPGYFHEEHTHLAVASLIASRQADAGLGISSAAERLNLFFHPITLEYYFLVLGTMTPALERIVRQLTKPQPQTLLSYQVFMQTFLRAQLND